MQQPDFYPHAVAENIQIIQTHAALIFLTGDYAYKVKKSVDFGFLDYSTLDKRKYFIEAELILNKKITPELYLEIATITSDNHKLTLNGTGNVVEYALKMRQFPQKNLFSNLLKAGKLSYSLLTKLGKIVAEFHSNADTNDRISNFGTADKIKAAFTENYQQSIKYIGIVQTEEQFAATKTYTDTFFHKRQDLFHKRCNKSCLLWNKSCLL